MKISRTVRVVLLLLIGLLIGSFAMPKIVRAANSTFPTVSTFLWNTNQAGTVALVKPSNPLSVNQGGMVIATLDSKLACGLTVDGTTAFANTNSTALAAGVYVLETTGSIPAYVHMKATRAAVNQSTDCSNAYGGPCHPVGNVPQKIYVDGVTQAFMQCSGNTAVNLYWSKDAGF